jgi:hypothetical protein
MVILRTVRHSLLDSMMDMIDQEDDLQLSDATGIRPTERMILVW